ncbi:BREX-2 system adenine-specific DNA-methyltransferase PglX [Luteimonas sp. MC1572]|uniref:BREX-2 system adenine-specific DNA-methyltransferase PglX n=1 Tax=Luteimonas sp. MC1572 TaxID=2799325 RepID=UPI0018F0C5C5|nr:BREX-2 system adenine-specific DNA-methyltransferase PglX [Luteimonas sp. MC1572]MBJ6981999.1 BREX-2 system adenine-specific DNA-methyltransferase PglX [Luteimonas sp. MC1572]QQO03298.1 BREX-2 system adenine-specific DNA-methyltransferase PglX [Luteimonas sp. MC1572]
MINAKQLLADLQSRQKALESDLRQQIEALPNLKTRLEAEYKAARDAGRTADTFGIWRDLQVTQSAVAWLLACTFVRFSEDNGLLPTPRLSGPGDALRRAKDAFSEYVRQCPTEHERHYLEAVFDGLAEMPALSGLFGRAHNPLFAMPLSYEAARDLLTFWQRTDLDTGALRHDFTDPELDTRFLGDLYQDLSEAARKRYALLQTPEFVEEFILDRTLEPAIGTFGLDDIRLIDPTCGSGHFLLGTFQRLLGHWQRSAPGMDARERVIKALAGVYGVDLNPFAVAIARFRLLVTAMRASGIPTLRGAPGWKFNLTTGDSLLHGSRFDLLGADDLSQRYPHAYIAEDIDEINRILGQRYHAVVGNPPYITASDTALNQLYRERYKTCHRKFSLGVPFTERFFQLALTNGDIPAGYVGLITADSFMKREFGKKLIEDWFPLQDVTHVIHTAGAYIPGHGTPTVILFGRNRAPVAANVRAVLGISGEPSTPSDPAHGLVWRSVVELTDRPGVANDYISVVDMERGRLKTHPWTLLGGQSPAVLDVLQSQSQKLGSWATVIGVFGISAADELMLAGRRDFERSGIDPSLVRPLAVGDEVRDWKNSPTVWAFFPYSDRELVPLSSGSPEALFWCWPSRTTLGNRATFSKKTYFQEGRPWWEWHQVSLERLQPSMTIVFAEVATHNHFSIDRGGKVFNRTAPIIKLPPSATEDDHLGLLGLLNCSVGLFWLRQNCHNKGEGGGTRVEAGNSALGDEDWKNHYAFNATRLKQFPLVARRPTDLVRQLDLLAGEHQTLSPGGLSELLPLSTDVLGSRRQEADALFARMVALQEELDWWCYDAYQLLDEKATLAGDAPGVALGERAFEIALARRIAAGKVESTWFSRHGSTPVTEIPTRWPAEYRALVERRINLIESNDWIGLLEQPEYKRRWSRRGWEELEKAALGDWLFDRLEAPDYWPAPVLQRVSELAARAERDADFMAVAALYTGQHGFDPAALLRELLIEESVPALKVLRYKEPGLRKRVDWEHTWEQQRREDAIDAAVAAEDPRLDDEAEADWKARIKPEQDRRKLDEVGQLPAPPKYTNADFLKASYWRLRGGLDVPKERCFTLPDPQIPGDWLYGWAGWNSAQRVRALAGAWIDGEERSGVDPIQLLPLLVAIDEELPWVLQWHNALDAETDVRLGDYFQSWLGEQLNRHGWTRQTLAEWRPAAASRGRRARAGS